MTRVLLDTNILVSAILNSHSIPAQAYRKSTEPPYQALVCEQTLEELRRVFNRKFPDKISNLERFITMLLSVVEIVPMPSVVHLDESEIRDVDDRPILRAALKGGVSILISGDKDFLESTVINPRIMTAGQFCQWDGSV